MGDQIPTNNETTIDMDETSDRPTQPTVAAVEPQNEPTNNIMYQTTATLLGRKGLINHVAVHLIAVYVIFFPLFIAFIRTELVDEQIHQIFRIDIYDWIKVFFFISMTTQLTICIIFGVIPRVLDRRPRFLLRRNMLYFTHGLKSKVGTLVTCGSALVTCLTILEKNDDNAKNMVTIFRDTTIALFVWSVLWLISNGLLLVLESSFCFENLFDRVVESLAHEYVIAALSGAPKASWPPALRKRPPRNTFFRCICGFLEALWDTFFGFIYGFLYSSIFIFWIWIRKKAVKSKQVRIDILELMKVPGDKFPLYTRQLLVEAISDSVNWTFMENSPCFMNTEQGAIDSAPAIFKKVAKPGNSYIEVEDLKSFLNNDVLELIRPMLDVDKNGHITLQSFSAWMVKAYKFRVALRSAAANNKRLFKRLKIVTGGLMVTSTIFLWLAIRKLEFWGIMAIILSQAAALTFIFGDSIKKAFDGAIYIFAVHPFDVGDYCVIGGTPVVIERMGLMTTTVKKFDSQKLHYPNTVLGGMPISNYTREPYMGDSLEFTLDLMTPEEKISQLKLEIERYFEKNKYHWKPEYSLVMKEVDATDKMKMVLNFNHTINFREFAVRDERKFALLSELRRIFKELQLKNLE